MLTALLAFFAPRLSVIAWLFPGSLILLALFMTTSLYPQGQPTWMPMWVYWTWNMLPTTLAQRVDYRQRAARVDRAIQAYYSANGHYPAALGQLVPRYLLSIPGPVIIIGQDWCYQGRDASYQFGYVTHQNWWTPYVSAAPVASHGDVSAFGPLCDAEI
jgi:hypothetical protein